MAHSDSETIKGTIVRVIQLDAATERVFKAFTNKQDVQEWLADHYEIDPRKGGKWRMGLADDGFVVTGEILEIVPDQLLVYSWQVSEYDTQTGKKVPNWMDANPTKVTVKFEKAGRGTKLTIRHEGFPERDEHYWGTEVGWELLAGEILKYYLEHPKDEFDKWWKEIEPTWQERWQRTIEARVKSSANG